MPIYEYECTKCHHQLEALQKVSEPLLTECPECHGATLQKQVSAAGFQLKGTGWYATDFRHKGKAPEKTSSTGSSDKTSDTSSPSSGDTTTTATAPSDSKKGTGTDSL